MEEVNWYAVYTKPRWEKKIAKNLSERGITVYCPLNKVVKQWSDRKKTVMEPLFKGYVFVQVSEGERAEVKRTDGIVNFVYWNGRPAIVRPEEIETIQRFLSEFTDIEVENVELQVNSPVIIKKGVLVNYRGVVVEVLGNKAKVLIESMGVQLSATIDRRNLEVI